MIVNDRVLSRIHTHLKNDKKPFRSKWCNTVGGWCLSYCTKYNKAPRGSILALFTDYAEKSSDEETVALMDKFLSSLSEDYKALAKEINEDFLLDMAARFFNQVRLERLGQSLESDLLNKDIDSAHKKVVAFNSISLATTAMVDVFTDSAAWSDAVREDENDVLIQYPGDLGEFFGPHLQRDGFISFLGPEKRGKSFWLIDMAWRAVLSKRKTLLYSVGDMSQKQMMRRLIVRAACRPLRGSEKEIMRPVSIQTVKGGEAQVKHRSKIFSSHITQQEYDDARELIQTKSASRQSLLKLKCTENSTTRVMDIQSDIDELVKDGWVPDVVVIDYADILAPEVAGGDDPRHQINQTWKALRRLSQHNHVLVVTATQSNALSYESKVLRRNNFSEDKRKIAHVTGMLGINQTEEEKEKEIFRLNWIALREGIYFESQCVSCAGSLAIANPAIVSCW